MAEPVLYPENEPTPFWPLLYLGPATIEVLFPRVLSAIEDDLLGGEVLDELINLRNGMRSHLQHHDIQVECDD